MKNVSNFATPQMFPTYAWINFLQTCLNVCWACCTFWKTQHLWNSPHENRCGDNVALPPNREVVPSDIISGCITGDDFKQHWQRVLQCGCHFFGYIWHSERKMRHPVMVSPLMTCHSDQWLVCLFSTASLLPYPPSIYILPLLGLSIVFENHVVWWHCLQKYFPKSIQQPGENYLILKSVRYRQ